MAQACRPHLPRLAIIASREKMWNPARLVERTADWPAAASSAGRRRALKCLMEAAAAPPADLREITALSNNGRLATGQARRFPAARFRLHPRRHSAGLCVRDQRRSAGVADQAISGRTRCRRFGGSSCPVRLSASKSGRMASAREATRCCSPRCPPKRGGPVIEARAIPTPVSRVGAARAHRLGCGTPFGQLRQQMFRRRWNSGSSDGTGRRTHHAAGRGAARSEVGADDPGRRSPPGRCQARKSRPAMCRQRSTCRARGANKVQHLPRQCSTHRRAGRHRRSGGRGCKPLLRDQLRRSTITHKAQRLDRLHSRAARRAERSSR